MSILDYIQFSPGVVDDKLCDDVLAYYKEHAKWVSSTFSSGEGVLPESDKRVKMDEYWIDQNQKYYHELKIYFRDAVMEYIDKYKMIAPQAFTPFRMNHYPVNGFMESHIDNIHHSHGQEYGYPHLTALSLLNDDYEGGELELCDGRYVAQRLRGSIIVFPSNFMYPHEVKKVTRGDRFSLMTWIM
jgi:predicted 2-oxoglutarate/Fe(II)-dependent dioxygenase YbiX